MSISYGGVTLPLPNAAAALWIEQSISLADVFEFTRRSWPGKRLLGLTFPGFIPDRPVKLGSLWWPRDASRYAIGHWLVTDDQLAAIRPQAYSDGGYHALPFILDDEAEAGRGVISTLLYMLPARPLAQVPGLPADRQLFLLTLVDERFLWWLTNTAGLAIVEGTTTWAQLYALLATILGVTLSAEAVDAAYLKPSNPLAEKYTETPLLLDAAAYNVGQRIVRNLGGTVLAQGPATARASLLANLDTFAPVKQAGGTFNMVPPSVDSLDRPGALPSRVQITFPRTDDGVPSASFYVVTVTLASLADTVLGTVGNGGTKLFRGVNTATFTGGADPTNKAELDALALRFATDFWYFSLPYADVVYAGVAAWVLEAQSDAVEWVCREGDFHTRVYPCPWSDLTVELLQTAAAGPPVTVIIDVTITYINDVLNFYNTILNFYPTTILNIYTPIILYAYTIEVPVSQTINGTNNDYEIGSHEWLRLDVGTPPGVITGMLGDRPDLTIGNDDGRLLKILNVGAYPITFKHESASSFAQNRLHHASLHTDITLQEHDWAWYKYDGTLARWMLILLSPSSVPTPGGGSKDFWYWRLRTPVTIGSTTIERWYWAGQASGAGGVAAVDTVVAAGQLIAMPFPCPKTTEIDALGINISNPSISPSKVAKLSVYDNIDDITLFPNNQLLTPETVAIDGVGAQKAFLSPPLTLPGGQLYWLVVTFEEACTITGFTFGQYALLGVTSSLGATPGVGWNQVRTYDGTIPDPFPQGSINVIQATAAVPGIACRVSG